MHLSSERLRPVIERVIVLGLLALVTIPAYSPSLNRFFAADQVVYFAEVNGQRSLRAGLGLCDHALTAKYNKGDEVLYRPLLFVLLAIENTWFGYDYTLWNLTNLVLHLLVAYSLYELLRALAPPWVAAAFALLFAVNRAIVEMVMWNHLGGYLMAFAFLLVALRAIYRLGLDETTAPAGWWWVYAVCVLGAMLSYEIGVFLAVLAPVYLLHRRRQSLRRVALATGLPLLVFLGLYAVHAARATRLFWVDPHKSTGFSIGTWLGNVATCFWQWIAEIVDPWRSEMLQVAMARFRLVPRGEELTPSISQVVVVLLLVLVACLTPAMRWRRLAQRLPFAGLVGMLWLAYVAMVNLGRAHAVDITYYLYLFALLATVIGVSLLEWEALSLPRQVITGAVLAVFIGAHATITRSTSQAVAAANEPFAAYYSMLNEFVEAHKTEPDFSFNTWHVARELDPVTTLPEGYPDKPTAFVKTTVAGMLYPQYYNPTNAKYWISYPPSTTNSAVDSGTTTRTK